MIGGLLPDEAWVTALAGLDQMGAGRLRAVLDRWPPAEAWQRVLAGDVHRRGGEAVVAALGGPNAKDTEKVVARWAAEAAAVDVPAVWSRHLDAGVGVAIRSSAAYPSAFADDPAPPPVVFTAGDPDVIAGARVAIVGTRNCTRYGFDVARRLGGELAEAGVSVVSGLALGIDGAAHAGALDAEGAPPIAVVGSGLDRPYPARNRSLWARIAGSGVVVSEYPLGTPPVAWHFPARNRLIAALADVVVVVESAEAGGSMITVDEAIIRGTDVLAVPGPVTAPSSAGTNKLLVEGRGAVRDAVDVLVALGLSGGSRRSAREVRPAPSPLGRTVLDALDWQPALLDQLVLRTGAALDELSAELAVLCADGWVDQRGAWFERVARAGG